MNEKVKETSLGTNGSAKIHPELVEFIEKVRTALKQRIDFTHDELRIESEPIKVLWTWAVALGAMAYDMSGSSLLLLENGKGRAAVVLNRCIFEYWVRLSFYEKYRGDAEQDIGLIKNRFRKIFKADPIALRSLQPSAEETIEIKQFLSEEGAAHNQRLRDMLDKTFSKPIADAYYDKYYALASIPAHGNELIMLDIFRDVVSGEQEPRVDYESRRFGVQDAGGVLGHLILNMLEVVDRNFAKVSLFRQLQIDFNRLQKRLGLL